METLGEYADIEAALNAAEVATYSISGRKVCKTCKAAAEDLLNARAEHAAEVAAAKSEAEALAARPLPGTESLSRIFDLDARIEVMQDRLAIAVDYATLFRTAARAAERGVGKRCVRTCRSRWDA